ncbi:MAG TPA: pyridoxal phosphate-dependent aminotransferase [Chloroflexota bacterium]|jgi:aspartate/methionine/tyrosine aminotransferase|nr:pyridoxal phosphate-dependent aminotransferase [Chloroflexota bacterium]
MTIKLASSMARLGTETAFEVLARAKQLEAQGRQVIHLEIGEPDFDTPSNIVEAACRALREGYTHYNPSPGIPELRATIARKISATRGIPVRPEQIVVTPGAKPIMFFTIMALAEPGDEVLYPDPGFPIYESMINYVGATAVPMPLLEEKRFRFDIDRFRASVTDRTRLIIVNSPANPTGGVLERSDLEAIAEVATARAIPVLTDEVYSEMVYDGEFASIASLPGMAGLAIILDGFSKTYAMTGWRIGFGVFPDELVPHISRLVTNSVSCTATFIQRAGIEALEGPQDEPQRMIAEFRRRRQVVVDGLNRIPGISCVTPAGAFYAFPNVKGTGMSSRDFANLLLDEYGVAALSGTSFGRYGEGYLRLSYANSVENIQKALERIERAVREHAPAAATR